MIRRMLAAAFGGMVAAIVGIFPWMNVIFRFFIMNVAASAIILWIAFGKMKKIEMLKQIVVFYLITYSAGGLINSLYYNTNIRLQILTVGNRLAFSNIHAGFIIIIFVCIIPIVLLLHWLWGKYQSIQRETTELDLFYEKRSIHAVGLMDTGNCLYEPITGKPVIILEKMLMDELLTADQQKEFESYMKFHVVEDTSVNASNNEGKRSLSIRMIPYQSIGKPHGMLPGLVLDKILINTDHGTKCIEKVVAAVYEKQLSTKKDYQIILHKDMVESLH